MGLTDRIAAAQRARTEGSHSADPSQENTPATVSTSAPKAARLATRDPFEDV